jgi:hypothetical protein
MGYTPADLEIGAHLPHQQRWSKDPTGLKKSYRRKDMTEQEPTTGQGAPAGDARTGSELLEELQSLGNQLTTAIKALWESEESRQLRQDIQEGFVELSHEIDEAIQSAQESDAAQEFSRQVKETMDRAREGNLAEKVETGLAQGLRKLNEELAAVTQSIQTRVPEDQAPESDDDTTAVG